MFSIIQISFFGDPEPSSGQNLRGVIIPDKPYVGRNDYATGLFLKATNRPPDSAVALTQQTDVAIAVEATVVRVVDARRN